MRRFRRIKIKGYKGLLDGLLVSTGRTWVLFRDNPYDYLLDGFVFVRKKFLLREVESEAVAFKREIFDLKGEFMDNYLDLNLDADRELFTYFQKTGGLVSVGRHVEHSILVGWVEEVYERSFRLRLVDRRGNILGTRSLSYDVIRSVGFGNDYLKSLMLMMRSPKYLRLIGEQGSIEVGR
ncbi:hypothetical protein [Dawidia soli]|uniref:Uncharacterized protein n=1 Tax=Dawidia soli TaxID=2782352 RepID=A0AAP2DAN8_9BACT|nr:hypothetical protein [Dawidia soli]MBT1688394.1 hypothetical protein [Dawidia soli]